MEQLNKMIDHLKEHAEETFKHYAEKENWEPQDLKCAKEAAELYDKLQTIQMNTGIWENMKEAGDYSFARRPHMSYGRDRDYDPYWDGGHPHSYGRRYSYGDPQHHEATSMHSVKDQAIQRLEQLMDSAKSEYEREEVLKMIKAVENQKR